MSSSNACEALMSCPVLCTACHKRSCKETGPVATQRSDHHDVCLTLLQHLSNSERKVQACNTLHEAWTDVSFNLLKVQCSSMRIVRESRGVPRLGWRLGRNAIW
eukprot:4418501-Amphidinium_carterae.1